MEKRWCINRDQDAFSKEKTRKKKHTSDSKKNEIKPMDRKTTKHKSRNKGMQWLGNCGRGGTAQTKTKKCPGSISGARNCEQTQKLKIRPGGAGGKGDREGNDSWKETRGVET